MDIWKDEAEDITEVEVKYSDGAKKRFNPYVWVLLRDGIKKNLFDRKLCTVSFLKETKKKRVKAS